MLYSHVLLSLSSLNFRAMKHEQIINNPPQWNKFQPTRPQSQHQSQPFMTPHWHRLNQQFAACIVDWQPALDTCWNYQQCLGPGIVPRKKRSYKRINLHTQINRYCHKQPNTYTHKQHIQDMYKHTSRKCARFISVCWKTSLGWWCKSCVY